MPDPRFDDCALVIPLYNEATVIGEVVRDARTVFDHVICVDDGSTDGSADVAREAGATVLGHPINLGQGAALQTGIEFAIWADFQLVVTFDADGQHRLEDAVSMVEHARDHDLAIVFGSRFLTEKVEAGFLKRLVLKTAALVTRSTTGVRLTDAHNGLRLMRQDAAAQLDLHQDRMAHATEIVMQLVKTRLPWAEYPVEVRYTEYSKAKGQSLLNSVNILVDLVIK